VEITSWILCLSFFLYTNCQNRPCGKEFNTTSFVNLLICNVNVNIILWRNLNIVSMPSTNINAKRISITRTGIYFAFFGAGGIEMTDWMNLLCWYIFIINAMRSCRERTTLHCVESYLYYIILVFFGAIDTIYVHCQKIYNSFPLAAKQVRKTRQYSYI
jgi:hypothetical protein